MARTTVPKYDRPIGMPMERLREEMQEMLERDQGDCDKSGSLDDAAYYQGRVDVVTDLFFMLTFPTSEDDARECAHANMVWFGHECGLCESEGYKWAEEA